MSNLYDKSSLNDDEAFMPGDLVATISSMEIRVWKNLFDDEVRLEDSSQDFSPNDVGLCVANLSSPGDGKRLFKQWTYVVRDKTSGWVPTYFLRLVKRA